MASQVGCRCGLELRYHRTDTLTFMRNGFVHDCGLHWLEICSHSVIMKVVDSNMIPGKGFVVLKSVRSILSTVHI